MSVVFVQEVPFDAWTAVFGIILAYLVASFVYLVLMWVGEGKEWAKKVDRWFTPCASCITVVAALVVLATHAALSHQRPAAEGDYEKLGTYTAMVARTYPQSQMVEVETDFGVSLPVPESMMPEGAATVGSQVTVDVSRLSSKPGLIVVRRHGDGVYSSGSDGPVFVASNVCKSAGVLSCSAAFGDTKGDDGLFPSTYYAVTAVRVS